MKEISLIDATQSSARLKPGRVLVIGHAYGGKSSLCRGLARLMDILHIDSGLFFRTIAYEVFLSKCREGSIPYLAHLCWENGMSIVEGGVVCNGHFLNEDILKSPVVNDLVPQIAAIPEVRDVVVRLVHKTTASLDSWIIGGRSPDEHPADCILWITADPEIRAQRLMQEMQRNGESVSLEKAMVILNWRDTQDMKREISPMYRPNDALVVDTTSLTIDEAIECAHQLLA